MKDNSAITGRVESRTCPLCGHHEMGFRTKDGEFHPLRSGMTIRIMPSPEEQTQPSLDPPMQDYRLKHEETTGSTDYSPWLPSPLRGDRAMRLKYGVLIDKGFLIGQVTGEAYQKAYMRKLQKLLTLEINIPLPVILDRYFTAPHLASGNPRQITEALWQGLDEIRKPVELVQAWLKQRDEKSIADIVHPRSTNDLENTPVGEEIFQKELEELGLEAFFELL